MKALLLLFLISTFAIAQDEFSEFEEVAEESSSAWSVSGFVELEQGGNISGTGAHDANPDSDNYVLANRRARLQTLRPFDWGGVYGKFDFVHDDVTNHGKVDIRELRVQYRAADWLDISAGRQVSTWGVADLLFINDLFPKNWVANFQGRDMEMLKDPNTSLRLTGYAGEWTMDLVYIPNFEADTTPSGCRFGVFDPNTPGVITNLNSCHDIAPLDSNGEKLTDDETAVMIKRKIGDHELAFYGYHGYWPSPRGLIAGPPMVGFHPRLNVFGMSEEGQVGPGIFSFETGYYDSKDDPNGTDYMIENSKWKYLVGYRMDLTANFSAGAQFYQERMMNYKAYEDSYATANGAGFPYRKKEQQDTYTLRLTYKAQQETLFVSLFTYVRPDDHDSFTKLEVSKKLSDDLKVTTGLNIFEGKENYRDREFGMLKDDDNAFVRINYSF
jgi:hypothetical protein